MARGRGGGGRSHGRGIGHRGHGIGHHGIGHHGFGHHHSFGRSRFGRHHGFGCHSSFRNHYHTRIGGGGGGGSITFGGMALMFDTVAMNPMPPTLSNGTYAFAGNQMAAISSMESFPTFYMTQIELAQGQPVPLNEASLYIIGNKTHEENTNCQMLTCVCGMCLIFPLCFTCCEWWKKICHPQYEVNVETYRAVGMFLLNAPSINNLTLEVVDNAFNAEKALVLQQAMMGRTMVGFTFVNHATGMDYNESEYSNFVAYVQPIKELPFQTNLEWDDEFA